jgi:hypothetical protein
MKNNITCFSALLWQFNKKINFIFGIIISQCSRQETNTLSPEGLPMSNSAVLNKYIGVLKKVLFNILSNKFVIE